MKTYSTPVSLLLLLAMLTVAPLSFAQQQQQGARRPTAPPAAATTAPDAQDDNGEIVVTREVNLPISVVDKKGVPVAGLSQNDFLVLEDKQPQGIKEFRRREQQSAGLRRRVDGYIRFDRRQARL
jgi:hypothetical protein